MRWDGNGEMTRLYIAGDWGTSNLRLYLNGPAGVQARVDGPGIATAGGKAGELLDELTRPWVTQHGSLPVLLAGMVGSSIGWVQTPYLECPAGAEALGSALLEVRPGVRIVPGLACVNPAGAPDVMRGEETQLIGLLALHPELRQGRHLICLPGTHAKWALVKDGVVETFQTALSGELFALLNGGSVLVPPPHRKAPTDAATFRQGAERGVASGGAILHRLFETRARQMRGQLDPALAGSFLSGLIIGADVAQAISLFPAYGGQRAATVVLVGEPALTGLYAEALSLLAVPSRRLDGGDCVLAGLAAVMERTQW
ncbi:2-keto-3-deoxygalactonate kinase [Azospirillum sp. RU38E]|nr:2-keto-3-deoxygalactonate kinase [Azospirillum sp. RU38E]SNS86362.1 2-keto-3-deoxygalactonate kinase [Azospirillum sp. RU37A]